MMVLDPIYSEDAFIFGRRKRRKARREKRRKRKAARDADPKIIARRERSKEFGRKLGAAYQDIGGASAIGRAIDSLTTTSTRATTTTNDSNINLGLNPELTDNNAQNTPQNNGVPVLIYVLGGVIIIGGISLFVIKKRKQQ